MDDEHFEDLFEEDDGLADSSQESLTSAAAKLAFDRDAEQVDSVVGDSTVEHRRKSTPPRGSITCNDGKDHVVREKIDEVFHQIEDALLHEKNILVIELKSRVHRTTKSSTATGSSSITDVVTKSRRVCFPGKTAQEAWRFTVVIRILELIHEAITSDVVMSKRDIFYRDPALFSKQSHVDRYVDDVAYTFSVPRSALNVIAVAKGLVLGALQLCRRDGSLIDAAADKDGTLVPNIQDILSVDMSSVRWILVVEKEATFRSIATSSFCDTLLSCGVMLTGKGYPDIATRALLRFISSPSPLNGFASPPVYGLVDFDPDGLAILSVYKHGSLALAHEAPDLCVPRIQWLGLRAEHISMPSNDLHAEQGLLTLTSRDRHKATKMSERLNGYEANVEDAEFRVALQMMLMLNIKAELQLLDARNEGMVELLRSGMK